jgi:hypothetical protein
MKILFQPTKNDHPTDGVEAKPHMTKNTPETADIPVVKGPKGLCYDVGKVADERRRKRILANRESAKSSRKRRLDEARSVHDDLDRLEDENSALRRANVALQRRITDAQAAIEHFHSFVGNANTACARELSVLTPPAPTILASLLSGELLNILRQCAFNTAIEHHLPRY